MNEITASTSEFYKENAESVDKAGGFIIIDGQEVASTLQCAHCGVHWIAIKGSGKVRGYCYSCRKVTCGAEKCHVCIPYEALIEFEEGTMNHYSDDILRKIHTFGTVY